MVVLRRLATLAVLAIACVVFLGKSYETTLQALDSSVHARLAINATHDGVIPRLPIATPASGGTWVDGFNDHPFVPFYVNGWIMRALGPSAWSARLLPGLFSVGCVWLTLLIGTTAVGYAYGLAAALVLALTPEFVLYGARFHLDTALTFFILLSFLMWMRGRPLLAGIAVGLAVWAKSPVGLLLLPTIVLEAAIARELRVRARPICVAIGAAVVTASALWVFVGVVGGWSIVLDYWQRQVWGTAVGGRGYGSGPEWLSFPKILKGKYWPWLPLLLMSLVRLIPAVRRRYPLALPRDFKLLAIGPLLLIVIVSAMRFRYLHYFLPAYPFVALLTVLGISRWLTRREAGLQRAVIGLGLVVPTLLVSAPIALSPEMFPALKRFTPIIISRASCEDRVLFVDGGHPYGSQADWAPLLGFYTARKILVARACDEAATMAARPETHWVIVAADHLHCVEGVGRFTASARVRLGTQWMLTDRIERASPIDLTDLERELSAPADCVEPPLPPPIQDRYHAY